jgi:mono/diheme cytochrome c family protein
MPAAPAAAYGPVMARWRRTGLFGKILIGAVVLLVLAQAVPYGRDHANPPATASLEFDSAATEELFRGACADCHSDQTEWPWYSNVAPVSWLVERDVKDGRETFDVSRWDTAQPAVDELVESIAEGEMPPLQYKVLHGGARLSAAEKDRLAAGLRRSYQADPPAATKD